MPRRARVEVPLTLPGVGSFTLRATNEAVRAFEQEIDCGLHRFILRTFRGDPRMGDFGVLFYHLARAGGTQKVGDEEFTPELAGDIALDHHAAVKNAVTEVVNALTVKRPKEIASEDQAGKAPAG